MGVSARLSGGAVRRSPTHCLLTPSLSCFACASVHPPQASLFRYNCGYSCLTWPKCRAFVWRSADWVDSSLLLRRCKAIIDRRRISGKPSTIRLTEARAKVRVPTLRHRQDRGKFLLVSVENACRRMSFNEIFLGSPTTRELYILFYGNMKTCVCLICGD